MRAQSILLLPVFLLAGAAGVLAHVRLINPSNQAPLIWSNPASIGIVISSVGSDNIPDDSEEVAIRLAIEEWNAVTGSSVQLIEDTTPSQQARTDFASSSIHLILFDENDSSGYFPGGSGTVAVTPIFFFPNGLIADADILFNGDDFSFTTRAQGGSFDVGDVATHELGHLIGLDHSAWAGGSMYPYVDPQVILHRSLSSDEIAGMRDIGASTPFARISGVIQRSSDSTPVAGANVVARDADGRTIASILTNTAGAFILTGLPPEDYTVYVVPLGTGGLDAPVTALNLTAGHTIQTDFQAGLYPGTTTISGTETVALGVLQVDGDIPLNLGTSADRFPMRVDIGSSSTLVLRGSGLNAGSTLTASDPDFIIGTPMFFGSQVSFQLTVPPGEVAGHVDLMISNVSGEVSILPAALEVTPPSPTVMSIAPTLATKSGGTAVTIAGTNFNPGARIVIGDQIYTDGVGGTLVTSPTSITLTTTSMVAATHDVVVIDATGVEGRSSNAFTAADVPGIDTVFPDAGFMAGGTDVVITGQDFLAGVMVRINGVDQGTPTLQGQTTLRFTTLAGSIGPQLLEIENPGGLIANSQFTFGASADPQVVSANPGVVGTAGGAMITLTGNNFTATTDVVFGADAETGAGGLPAAGVVWVDANTLDVTTPAFSVGGAMTILVRDSATNQGTLLASALTIANPSSGGGGGCYTVPVQGPGGPKDVLMGAWWILAVMLALGASSRRAALQSH